MEALTKEQASAVARRDGSLLLTAGAGSGKTSVLVERFVRAVIATGAGWTRSSRSRSPRRPPPS